jgi:hypothetical protein
MSEILDPIESAPAEDRVTPWIETREGMLFFWNALLVSPQFVVFFPLAMLWIVAPIGAPESLVQTLKTIPTLAQFALPFTGWFFAVPAWFAWRSRRETHAPIARQLEGMFAVLHVTFVVYAAWFWLTGQSFPAT